MDILTIGNVQIISGSGNPQGVVTAPKGSVFIDKDNLKIYQNTDSATSWTEKT